MFRGVNEVLLGVIECKALWPLFYSTNTIFFPFQAYYYIQKLCSQKKMKRDQKNGVMLSFFCPVLFPNYAVGVFFPTFLQNLLKPTWKNLVMNGSLSPNFLELFMWKHTVLKYF